MLARRKIAGFLLVLSGVLVGGMAGCGNPNGLDSIQVTPATETINTGQTAQLTAIGTFGNAKHSNQQNVTTAVTWTSNKPSVATVDNAGLVTAVGAGTVTITATAEAFNGQTSSSSLVTVTGQGGGGGSNNGGSLLSLTIIPSAISVGNLQSTGQFLAIGTFSVAPFVRDLTNSPNLTWISSFPSAFPVNNTTSGNPGATAGIVTAYASGNTVITAEAKNPTDGTIQTATATFACPLVIPTPTTAGSCFLGSEVNDLLKTITIYNEGLNSTSWRVFAPSATGTQDVVHCGPGSEGPSGSICTTTYPVSFQIPANTVLFPGDNPVTLRPNTVLLKAMGGAFGGWSSSCLPSDAAGNTNNAPPATAAGPNYCVIDFNVNPNDPFGVNSNVTVGAIFN